MACAGSDVELADIIVTEIFDSELIGEGVLPTMRHATANLLKVRLLHICQESPTQHDGWAGAISAMQFKKKTASPSLDLVHAFEQFRRGWHCLLSRRAAILCKFILYVCLACLMLLPEMQHPGSV